MTAIKRTQNVALRLTNRDTPPRAQQTRNNKLSIDEARGRHERNDE
jgi:hypothetical protein